MFSIKKAAAVVAASAAMAAGGVSVAAPADAVGSPGCVTRTEFRNVHQGDSQARVARVFGTWGKVTSRYEGSYIRSVDREYKVCNSRWGWVDVSFENNWNGGSRVSLASKYFAFI